MATSAATAATTTTAQSFALAWATLTDKLGMTSGQAATVFAAQSGADATQAIAAEQVGLFDLSGATGIAQQLADAVKSALWRVTLILALVFGIVLVGYLALRKAF